ncbi:prephenate dehydrogenase [Garciella nitratireducens]|uniref:prephenate dehydrogenase n=1 Tax=Garciella nitratireducens TaxID=218205 RepID=UPI000DEB6E70|nr:prephenate dehydrogenase [Garciella nitratireducens]RBP42702.1 prephenate dehydrogenase [Garciella nitratireducens]
MDLSDFAFSKLNITIVGLGLIGGSFALALKELNPNKLWAIDKNRDILVMAEEKGVIDKGYFDPKTPLEKSDIVVIALYPKSIIKFVKDNLNHFKSGAVITDTAGLKENIVQEIHTFIREDVDFIGGHPMAGREFSGFSYASKKIFIDSNYILTPIEENQKEHIHLLKSMIRKIGFKNVVYLEPKKHDEIIAFISHLPHVIASTLVNSKMLEEGNSCIGRSFKDMTRVAYINSDLWTELFLENRENLICQIDLFQRDIEKIKKALQKKDRDTLKSILDNSSLKKEEFNNAETYR